MKVTNARPFATQNVVPFRKRLGLMGLGDDAADAAAAEFGGGGVAPMTDYTNPTPASYADIVAAQTAQAAQASGSNNPAIDATTANLIANLAKIGAGAYTQTQQAQVGIAPPGYTYRGYASNITSGYGNLAPPGYSYSGMQANGYPYQTGTPYAAINPQVATGTISTNTLLLMAGLAAVVMIANKHDDKKR